MSKIFKCWAIGMVITTLIILLYFLGIVIYEQLSRLSPEIAKIVEFAFAFGLTSIYFGCIVWVFMANKD